jgi:hypothetical protein
VQLRKQGGQVRGVHAAQGGGVGRGGRGGHSRHSSEAGSDDAGHTVLQHTADVQDGKSAQDVLCYHRHAVAMTPGEALARGLRNR